MINKLGDNMTFDEKDLKIISVGGIDTIQIGIEHIPTGVKVSGSANISTDGCQVSVLKRNLIEELKKQVDKLNNRVREKCEGWSL